MFSDSEVRNLMQSYPRDRIQVFVMGTDPTRRLEWQPVDVGRASGEDLWEAISRGRMWCKLLQMHAVDARFRKLLDELYHDLADQCPGFKPANMYGTLIVSSPTALVYYHADAQPNLLWHIRGRKRVWVYPADDRELIDQDLMEDIVAGFVDEEAPYDPTFDRKSKIFEMQPGDVISWPQSSPHRVTNQEGVNISLSTVHETEESYRRNLIYRANRLLRRGYRLPFRSVEEAGISAVFKRAALRACGRLGLVEKPARRVYMTSLQVDATAPTGLREIPNGPVLTTFSSKDFKLEKDAAGNVIVAQRAEAPSTT